MLQRREEFVIDLIRDDREARPFWKSVHAVRAAWGITPRTGLPTYTLNDAETIAGLGVGAPPVWPAEPPLRPVVKPLHPDLNGQPEPLPLDLLMQLPPEWGRFGPAWWLELKHLHDWFIPPKCQTLSQHPEQAWAPFLSQCLLFDPPRDRLRPFVAAAPAQFDRPADIGEPASTPGTPSAPPRSMLHAPVRRLRDGEVVERALRRMNEGRLQQTRRRLLEKHGIDLSEILKEADARWPQQAEADRASLETVPIYDAIIVGSKTTDADDGESGASDETSTAWQKRVALHVRRGQAILHEQASPDDPAARPHIQLARRRATWTACGVDPAARRESASRAVGAGFLARHGARSLQGPRGRHRAGHRSHHRGGPGRGARLPPRPGWQPGHPRPAPHDWRHPPRREPLRNLSRRHIHRAQGHVARRPAPPHGVGRPRLDE